MIRRPAAFDSAFAPSPSDRVLVVQNLRARTSRMNSSDTSSLYTQVLVQFHITYARHKTRSIFRWPINSGVLAVHYTLAQKVFRILPFRIHSV